MNGVAPVVVVPFGLPVQNSPALEAASKVWGMAALIKGDHVVSVYVDSSP